MSAPPFMQMYWSDYFGDTRHLSCEQHGAYLQLLGSMWLAGGSLPNDARKLAKITGCTASRWAKIAVDVLAFFDIAADTLTHKRIGIELEKAHEKSIKRAEAGSRGGTAKALKTHAPDVAIATDLPQHLPEPEPEIEVSEANASSPRTAPSNGFPEFWSAYPDKVGKRPAAEAYAKALKRITGPDPPGVLLAGVERAKASRKWREGIIPNPATWLNQDRWEDEPAEVIPLHGQPHERPHHDAKFDSRQANYATHDRGADLAARLHGKP